MSDSFLSAGGFGPMGCAGIEETRGGHGAGLSRHLEAVEVSVEVERPKRHHFRPKGNADPSDAEAAIKAVLAGVALGEVKNGDGWR